MATVPVGKSLTKSTSRASCTFCLVCEYQISVNASGFSRSHPFTFLRCVVAAKACLHVARVSRVLQQDGGHALLIGVGGSGKQSLAKLAVFMAELAPMTVIISKSYGVNDFKADLQAMFTKAGVKGQGVGFLFMDNQIVQERFLVSVQRS